MLGGNTESYNQSIVCTCFNGIGTEEQRSSGVLEMTNLNYYLSVCLCWFVCLYACMYVCMNSFKWHLRRHIRTVCARKSDISFWKPLGPFVNLALV